ncbi:hypothetical protein ONZ45_g1571 [Pleurotus djamor]|nr:hypothetical protein ONZ45_g1571 [Pleurotus djamor]
MGSSSEYDYADEKKVQQKVAVSAREVDTGALLAGGDSELDPAEALRISPLLVRATMHSLREVLTPSIRIQFMDKTTLGSSAILGIREATHLTTNQYNWLGTIFYLSYLAFEYPQNLALQRFPVALCAHAACKDFGGLFAVRFVLGMCEGSITAGFMIVSSMFYTRTEQTLRVGYWFLMNGTAQIISGFISFGSLHIKTGRFAPWQWLMIITGILTILTAIAFWLLFPDSPTNAWFLTPDERIKAVQRIKENQTGVENKHFKKDQMIEALLDPKTWLFALFSALDNVPNSLTNQRQIIVSGFGFTPLQTTLLGCVDGVVEIVTIFTGVHIAAHFPNSRAYVGFLYMVPNLLGVFLVNFLSWENKIGLLFSVWLTGVGTTGFVLALSWLSSVTAGHTKRVTTNAIMLSAYCIVMSLYTLPRPHADWYLIPRIPVHPSSIVNPIPNHSRRLLHPHPFDRIPYLHPQPNINSNHIPWIIIGICYACCMALLLLIRLLLSRENKRRETESHDSTYDDIYVETTTAEGETVTVKVAKEFLDLTDIQNRDFRGSTLSPNSVQGYQLGPSP